MAQVWETPRSHLVIWVEHLVDIRMKWGELHRFSESWEYSGRQANTKGHLNRIEIDACTHWKFKGCDINSHLNNSVETNIWIYSNIFFQILIFVFDSWTFSESKYYSNIRIFWSEYSEIIWWKNTWFFKKQRQNLNNILEASSKFKVIIDESQCVQNSF